MVPIDSILAVAASGRVGDVGNPSNRRTNSVATAGCLARIIGKQSDQLAQNVATFVRQALCNPRQPKDIGNVAASTANSRGMRASPCSPLRLVGSDDCSQIILPHTPKDVHRTTARKAKQHCLP